MLKIVFYFFAMLAHPLAATLGSLTIEEKVGQLFITYTLGTHVNDHTERLFRETKIGGIILYEWANGLMKPQQVKTLCCELQVLATSFDLPPLLLAVDQEGGRVARLRQGFTSFPSNKSLGDTGDPQLAYDIAYALGNELKDVGINFNLAPVVDVNNNPLNPVIGDRSFGDNPALVAEFGYQSLAGFLDAGIIPCLKHFPGHGDVTVDSHAGLPVVDKGLPSLIEMELFPFAQLASVAPAIMTAHILFPALDPDRCATLSPVILQSLLRDTLGFQGVIITDSLVMRGVRQKGLSLEEVVVQAFEAGNDILLIGGPNLADPTDRPLTVDEFIRVYRHFVEAVRCGRISEERLNQSVERILQLKRSVDGVDRVDEGSSSGPLSTRPLDFNLPVMLLFLQ